MKTCSKCNKLLPYSSYNKDSSKPDGYYSSCKTCKLAKDYEWVKNNPGKVAAIQKRYWQTDKGKQNAIRNTKNYRVRYPEKRRAHSLVQDAVKRGDLILPTACEECGKTDVQLDGHHHKGYSKKYQLDVVWLCRQCHKKKIH